MASILCTWYNVSFSSTPSFYVSRIAVEVSFDKKGLLEAVQMIFLVSIFPSMFSMYLTEGTHISSITGMVWLYYSQSSLLPSGGVGGSLLSLYTICIKSEVSTHA
jgi:hypothetical protein